MAGSLMECKFIVTAVRIWLSAELKLRELSKDHFCCRENLSVAQEMSSKNLKGENQQEHYDKHIHYLIHWLHAVL